MDEIVHDVRHQQWLSIIQACNASGQSKNQWCDENGISRRKFYYWQKKLRTELYQEAQERSCISFVQPSNTGNNQSALVIGRAYGIADVTDNARGGGQATTPISNFCSIFHRSVVFAQNLGYTQGKLLCSGVYSSYVCRPSPTQM